MELFAAIVSIRDVIYYGLFSCTVLIALGGIWYFIYKLTLDLEIQKHDAVGHSDLSEISKSNAMMNASQIVGLGIVVVTFIMCIICSNTWVW